PTNTWCLALFPDEGLLVGGENQLRRLRPDGTPDLNFGGDALPFGTYGPAVIQPDGGVVFAVNSTNIVIARVDSAGRLQPDFAAAVFQPLSRYSIWRSEEHTSELQSRFDLVC